MNVPSRRVLAAALVLLAALILLPRTVSFVRHRGEINRALSSQSSAGRAAQDWGDRFGDGTPNFLRLTDPADQAAFRRWFTLIAEYQAIRPRVETPPEIIDCASLLRFSYREALKRHNDSWFKETGIDVSAPPGEIRAWHYPDTPLGAALFRVRAGSFEPADITNGAFAQFADAKTLVELNAYLVSRDVHDAQPGDLLFYRQFGQSPPWHSMIVTEAGPRARLVYHTGPDHNSPGDLAHGQEPVRGGSGELRRVLLSDLLAHPQPQWRPVAQNPNFLGVYRWNILRGNP